MIRFLSTAITRDPTPLAHSAGVLVQHPVPPPVLDPPSAPHSPQHLPGGGPLPRHAPKKRKKNGQGKNSTARRMGSPSWLSRITCVSSV